MRKLFYLVAFALLALVAVAALAITLGGPEDLPPMPSINAPFKEVDFSAMPVPLHFQARDGTRLAFRRYEPATTAKTTKGSMVLVHGSSASSASMHPLATALAAAGYATYALDMRGHGASGVKGHVAYIGQLEADVEDFLRLVQPPKPFAMAGFSAGGGFVLRYAGSPRQTQFAGYLLLAPFVSQDAPTYRPDSGGWVSVGLPRIIAISVLDKFGIELFNDLPVTRFAVGEASRDMLTPEYSYALAQNFRPLADYRANIRAAKRPMRIVAGMDDEVFHAERFSSVFESAGNAVPVTLLPGIGHVGLTLDAVALKAVVTAADSLH
jgi:alpha-beta hydrolase superfamily lysophospholipase